MATNILDLVNHVQQQGELGRTRGKQSALAKLASQSYGAPREQQQQIVQQAIGVDPDAGFALGKQLQSGDEARHKQIASAAKMLVSLPEQARPGYFRQVAPQLRQMGLQVGDDYLPEYGEMAQKIAEAWGGVESPEDFTLSPGSARYGADGKLIASQPFAPANTNLVSVPDGQGGSLQMIYDPRTQTFSQPNYGGMPAPTTGGGGQILEDAAGAALDPVTDFPALAQFPGVQVSSLARDPNKNAKVGGVGNSFHLTGEAGDFVVPQDQRQAFIARARSMGYQAIDEGDHVHVEPPQRGITASQFAPGQGVAQTGQMGYTPPKAKGQVQMLSPQEVTQLGLPAGTVAQRKPDGSISVVNKPTKGGDKPQMPVRAVMADLEIEDALGASESVFRLAEKHLSRMANGELVVGTPEAAGAAVRTFLNMPNDNDVALTELKADRTSIVNASLRLNKGVQTEGDAQRAVKELMAADDHKTTLAALKRLIEINKRAVQLQTRKRNLLRQNYQGGEATQQTQADDDIDSLMEMYR